MSAAEQIPDQRRWRADSVDTTEVRVAADAARLHVVRSVVAGLALRADFDLDAADDLRLAVDEACSSLVRLAIPGTRLVARFQVAPDAITGKVTVIAAEDAVLRRDTFGWRVLTTLVTEVTAVARTSEHRTGQLLEIEFVKVRREAIP
ncbi:ATP-binding protein [Actinoalloteichus hymeniacidonis]|uniref:Histidine kinase-like ATPase domain n=1 Tax=Actinoalloteichus hymeniacidonis TaxID=340345 RepID=A0AAC9MXA8_9PSEU|nr:ATP-binding protein [Actinoalloteichus hymeniacidonis]AOS63028.1 Histidine kinase-like ATPase domain [Actinoalloteichus hymeniacidonis]MBB5908937.1 serine/threonine-protein kinase RsbW [Actinoalloteichus hymeniacidonis]